MNPIDLDPSRKWLTRDEAAAAWGMTPDGFSSLVSKGLAPKPHASVGRTPMWDEELLLAAKDNRPGRGRSREKGAPEA